MGDLDAVMAERRQLLGMAYRLLGSVADAEDVVQETYARWYAQTPEHRAAIESPGAWLTKVAGRVCLDQLGSARVRRERYVGEWVPEPVPASTDWITRPGPADPADRVTLDESINMAFLVVLDAMTPAERVAFILHDVFGYPFTDIADITGRTPAACRKLASSARHRIRAGQPAPTPPAERAGIVRGFKEAWAAKDIAALVGLLDPDAIAVADGGGLVNTLPRPIVGRDQIARYAVEILKFAPAMTIMEATVNGQPGLVAQVDGVTATVMAFEVADGLISRMWAVRNPEKLRLWTAGPVS
ncbi:RNA polymerase sigma factor SigJ [Hamadaea tsunoensis]|uniref:RNA polymerase sigma factor SigJ n=1 Tax=Hamadaea tsunoensis TaxID=53368 RepID=UPI0004075D9E|nr:RNA polymerase sigma factor SigJ [Hamadaea tsunoensis]